MSSHFNLNDSAFENAFANASLPPELFSHEAHIRLAWIHIMKYGEARAIENVCAQIIQYVTKLGAQDKFNKTLTIAAVKAVSHFIKKEKIENFQDFIQTYPRLKFNFKELLGYHYGFDIFNSTEAKTRYLEPDLLPFT